MSLSLVPEYDSATSSSDSEAEAAAPEPRLSAPAQPGLARRGMPAVRELGSKLSSILPPPRRAASTSAAAAESSATPPQKVRIVVDLPGPRAADAATVAESNTAAGECTAAATDVGGGVGSAGRGPSGSLSSELFSMLPAPRNSRPAPGTSRQPPAEAGAQTQAPGPVERPLIPHSLSSKHRSKAKPADRPAKAQPAAVAEAKQPTQRTNTGDGGEEEASEDARVDPAGGSPFFTIGADIAPESTQPEDGAAEAAADVPAAATSNNAYASLVYDPASGYYYDNTSGVYYHYDADRGEYVDTRTLYPAGEPGADSDAAHDSGLPEPRSTGGADLDRLLRRGALRHGEVCAALGSGLTTVTQSAQLAGGGYSDAKAAASYSAKRAVERQRLTTRRRIDSDEVGKQKKSKHNIMYLALRAQEQEASLDEAHAQRKASKKAAQARYGY